MTTALFAETENEKYASVVVVIRANSSIERFENLRGKKACIAEFGSIGNAETIAFVTDANSELSLFRPFQLPSHSSTREKDVVFCHAVNVIMGIC